MTIKKKSALKYAFIIAFFTIEIHSIPCVEVAVEGGQRRGRGKRARKKRKIEKIGEGKKEERYGGRLPFLAMKD